MTTNTYKAEDLKQLTLKLKKWIIDIVSWINNNT